MFRLKNWIGISRFWLTLGAVFLLFAMGLTYHNAQNLAAQTLQSKVKLPDPVRIQDFDRQTDVNLLGELQVLAEVDVARSVRRAFGEGSEQEEFLLVPVYAVSEGSRVRVEQLLGDAQDALHRPVARPVKEQSGPPEAILLFDLSRAGFRPRSAEALGLNPLGGGFHGDLVVLAGQVFARSDVAVVAQDVFGLSETESVAFIAPYLSVRATASGADMSEARNFLAAAGLVSVMLGLSLLSADKRADHMAHA